MDRNRASDILETWIQLSQRLDLCLYISVTGAKTFLFLRSLLLPLPSSFFFTFLSFFFFFFFKPAFLLLSSCWYSSQLKESHMILKWRKIYLKWVMGILPIFTFLFLHVVCNITIFTGYRFDIVLFSVLQRNQ